MIAPEALVLVPATPRMGSFLQTPSFPFAVLSAVCAVLLAPAASAQYTDVATSLLADPGAGFGVAWGDYDRDGDQDLFLSNGSGSNMLYRNDDGVFVDVTGTALAGSGGNFGAAWGDCDDDGDLDLYVINGNGPNELCRNDSGSFSSITGGDVKGSDPDQSVAWADFDQDGDLDLYVTSWQSANRLLRNDGGGMFSSLSITGLDDAGKGTGVAWADYDNDGDQDLFFGTRLGGFLFRNDGGGVFADVTAPPINKTGITGAAWGDYDNDGDLDLYMARDLLSNRLLRNDSSGGVTSFVDQYIPNLRDEGFGQGVVWVDYDNDMDLDIFLANAGVNNGTGDANKLIKNHGNNVFGVVYSSPYINVVNNSRGVAAADFNQDGWVDLYVANWYEPNQLLRRIPSTNHWFHIDLVGVESNRYAIGARVRVVAGGVTQIREISGGSSLYSQNAFTAYFGLGANTTVDTVEVTWPSGTVTDTTDISGDQLITMYESPLVTGIGDQGDLPNTFKLFANAPNPFRSSTVIRYEIIEPTPVDLRILDVAGRLVRVVEQTSLKDPGTYEFTWNGQDDSGRRLAEGVYFFSLSTEAVRKSHRMVLLR